MPHKRPLWHLPAQFKPEVTLRILVGISNQVRVPKHCQSLSNHFRPENSRSTMNT